MHQAIEIALADLIQRRGPAGDERRADDGGGEHREIHGVGRSHVEPAAGCLDDQRIHADLRENEQIRKPITRGLDGKGGGFHAAAPAKFNRAELRPKRARCARSVSTSEVTSTSAPLATCAVLITGCLPLSTTSAPSVIWTATSSSRTAAGRVSSRRPRW